MDAAPSSANPFALMMEPEAVLKVVEHSERLLRLKSRVCRPLDKPVIPTVDKDVAAYDRAIDAGRAPRERFNLQR